MKEIDDIKRDLEELQKNNTALVQAFKKIGKDKTIIRAEYDALTDAVYEHGEKITTPKPPRISKPVIRPRFKCKCGSSWEKIGKKWICKQCGKIPHRFLVDIWFAKKRYQIFSDKQGMGLAAIEQAQELLNVITSEIVQKTFDIENYRRIEQEKYQFKKLIEQWHADKVTDAENGQISKSYTRPLNTYIKHYILPFFKGVYDVRTIRTVDIKRFVRQLPNRLSAKYRRNILNALENFFNTLIEDDVYKTVKPKFPTISIVEPEVKWCDRNEQDKILEAIPKADRFIFYFLTRQGCRVGEAIGIRYSDISISNGTITIKRTMSDRKIHERTKTKTAKARLLHPELLKIIKKMPTPLKKDAYLFINPRTGKHYVLDTIHKVWNKACKDTGIDIKLNQAGRHSVASMAVSNGVSLSVVKDVLQHADIRTTQKYAHVDVLAQGQVFEAQTKKKKKTSRG